MKISLVVSTRDNLKYSKWSYDSIRKNQGNHEVWLCFGIDHCTDGTQEWIEEIKKTDPFVKSIENKTGQRLGCTIMYDQIVNQLVETDLAMIFHSDMYLCPKALDEVENLMYDSKRVAIKNRITSLTRIEPPLWEPSPEKIIKNFGFEPEDFEEIQLLQFSNRFRDEIELHGHTVDKNLDENYCTDGIFAPWAFWVDEFKEIGGHDLLFAPQSKEDSDIFNRFKLKFGENCFKQTRKGFVYHLCCRGSRFNPNITTVGVNSSEWELQNTKASRNFIRKWGSFVKHTTLMNPIIPPKFNIGFILRNASFESLAYVEPWCDRMVCPDLDQSIINRYIEQEQRNTRFNLTEKLEYGGVETDIVVEIDGKRLNEFDVNVISNLSEIIKSSGEIGEFELGNLKITIKSMQTYEHELIVCKNEPINLS